jgi:hypothetical protein
MAYIDENKNNLCTPISYFLLYISSSKFNITFKKVTSPARKWPTLMKTKIIYALQSPIFYYIFLQANSTLLLKK